MGQDIFYFQDIFHGTGYLTGLIFKYQGSFGELNPELHTVQIALL